MRLMPEVGEAEKALYNQHRGKLQKTPNDLSGATHCV